MVDWISIGVALLIIAAVLFTHWSGQRAGVASTGSSRQIRALFAKVKAVEEKMATKADLTAMGAEMRRIEDSAATSDEVHALAGKLDRVEERIQGRTETLKAEIAAVKETGEHTRDGVRRIETFLIEGRLGK